MRYDKASVRMHIDEVRAVAEASRHEIVFICEAKRACSSVRAGRWICLLFYCLLRSLFSLVYLLCSGARVVPKAMLESPWNIFFFFMTATVPSAMSISRTAAERVAHNFLAAASRKVSPLRFQRVGPNLKLWSNRIATMQWHHSGKHRISTSDVEINITY